MSKKMSYAVAVTNAIEGHIDAETIETLTRLRESLNKRNSGKSGKPTKAQIANAEIGEQIVATMESGVQYTIADVRGLVPALADATPQKIAPLMKKLVEAGAVETTKTKGKNFYTKVAE